MKLMVRKLNNMKIKGRSIGYVLAIIGIGLIVYLLFFKKAPLEVEVSSVIVKSGSILSTITATGTVEPITQVEVGTQVSAEVKNIYVDYNSIVYKGQLIAEIDKTNLKTAVLNAQANYDKSLNEKRFLEGVFNRQKDLFDSKLISESEYEEALYNLESIKGTVTQGLSSLTTAKTNLSYANIYSPIDGVVLSKDVSEGQTVAASLSSPTLFTIAQDLIEMQVEANVDEADIGQVKKGQRVTFFVDAYPDEVFSGTVTQVRLNPTVTSNVVTYAVIIKAKNPEKKLMPGLTATVSIFTYEAENVLTLETKAVNFNPSPELLRAYREMTSGERKSPKGQRPPKEINEMGTVVWVMKDSVILPIPVQLGMSDGINIEIKEGVVKGDEIVYDLSIKEEKSFTPNKGGGSPFIPKPPGRK